MSVDIKIRCKRDPARLARPPFGSRRIFSLSISGFDVDLNCGSVDLLLLVPYVQLVARTFDGVVELDGERDDYFDRSPLDAGDLESAWAALDRATQAEIDAAEAEAARKQAAWEALDRSPPGTLDKYNDWSAVMPRDRPARKPAVKPTAKPIEPSPSIGATVTHPTFGEGSIVRWLDGDKVEVRFRSGDVKTLYRTFVQLPMTTR